MVIKRTQECNRDGGKDAAKIEVQSSKQRQIQVQKDNKDGNPTVLTGPVVKIERNNFLELHQYVRAAKYKVHAPNCTCSKIERIRKRYTDLQSASQNGRAENSTTVSASQYKDGVQFDIDGSFSQRFEKQLHVYGKDSIFDNLIVIPDTARPSAAYICKDTNSKSFQMNGTACEQRLAMEIFSSEIERNNAVSSFKVSCAICLLTRHSRNGFVAFTSQSFDQLQPVLQKARLAAKMKMRNGLHPDHAHFLCAMEVSSLRTFLYNSKTRSAQLQNVKYILTQMENAGVNLSVGVESGEKPNCYQNAIIELGHHLVSLLHILVKNSRNQTEKVRYIMVIGYQHSSFSWKLDLPGGKRHLGESTIDGAIREVEEECSLSLNKHFFKCRLSIHYGGTVQHDSNEVMQVFETSGDAFILVSLSPQVNVGKFCS